MSASETVMTMKPANLTKKMMVAKNSMLPDSNVETAPAITEIPRFERESDRDHDGDRFDDSKFPPEQIDESQHVGQYTGDARECKECDDNISSWNGEWNHGNGEHDPDSKQHVIDERFLRHRPHPWFAAGDARIFHPSIRRVHVELGYGRRPPLVGRPGDLVRLR